MKFTLSWLKRHLDTDASLEQICASLTAIGLELEGLENPAEDFAAFKVALVTEAEKHPDADRLQVLSVKFDGGETKLVCGAPNARAGMKGVFAPEGAYIPGSDMVLKKANIRGVDSIGMMVSESEMGLSDEHDGIIEVDDSFEIGTPMVDVFGLNDPIIEINLTPNRADCAGVRGIARDLAAAGLVN
jgi:phenylalanyl-tRNA synthetase beta chain